MNWDSNDGIQGIIRGIDVLEFFAEFAGCAVLLDVSEIFETGATCSGVHDGWSQVHIADLTIDTPCITEWFNHRLCVWSEQIRDAKLSHCSIKGLYRGNISEREPKFVDVNIEAGSDRDNFAHLRIKRCGGVLRRDQNLIGTRAVSHHGDFAAAQVLWRVSQRNDAVDHGDDILTTDVVEGEIPVFEGLKRVQHARVVAERVLSTSRAADPHIVTLHRHLDWQPSGQFVRAIEEI